MTYRIAMEEMIVGCVSPDLIDESGTQQFRVKHSIIAEHNKVRFKPGLKPAAAYHSE